MSSLSAFLVAAALVSPFAVVTFRRLWRERQARRQASSPPPATATPPADPDDVSTVVATFRREVEAHFAARSGQPLVLPVPHATLGGRAAGTDVVAALIVDDLRRRGYEADRFGDCLRIRCTTG